VLQPITDSSPILSSRRNNQSRVVVIPEEKQEEDGDEEEDEDGGEEEDGGEHTIHAMEEDEDLFYKAGFPTTKDLSQLPNGTKGGVQSHAAIQSHTRAYNHYSHD
jgi:hypothetical protein